MSVTIKYQSSAALEEQASVQVAANVTNWQGKDAQRVSAHEYAVKFDINQYGLTEGSEIVYKFIVNGVWKLSDDGSQTQADDAGNINHVLKVTNVESVARPETATTSGSCDTEQTTVSTSVGDSELRNRKNERKLSQSSTTSTVMVKYEQNSPYQKFLQWSYAVTIGMFVSVLRFFFRSS